MLERIYSWQTDEIKTNNLSSSEKIENAGKKASMNCPCFSNNPNKSSLIKPKIKRGVELINLLNDVVTMDTLHHKSSTVS